jgi:DNA-binding response OmpR family regulator
MEHSEEQPLLIAQKGPLDGERWVIKDHMVIGRDPDADVVVLTPDKQVSRRHAELTRTKEGVMLEDLESKNGTHLNGSPISGSVLLKDGDTIQIALAQQFVYLSSDATVPLQMPQTEEIAEQNLLLYIDKRARRVWVGDRELIPPLSLAQYNMMELLSDHNGQVVSRQALIEAVWGEEEALEVSNQALDALVRRLRERLAELDEHNFIITVRGHGLRLDNPEKE